MSVHHEIYAALTIIQEELRKIAQPLSSTLNFRLGENRISGCVESDRSKNLEPDIQVGCTDGIFIKSSGSAMAEEPIFMAILLAGRSVSLAVVRVS